MPELLSNPLVQSGIIPFACSFGLAGMMVVSGIARSRPAWLTGLIILVGFLVAYLVIFGLPPLLPKSSGQKIFYVAVLGAAIGLYLDMVKASSLRIVLTSVVLCLGIVIWIGWRKVSAAPSLDHLQMLLLLAGFVAALFLTETSRHDGTDEAIPLLLTCIALAIVAVMSASASIGQSGGALAAALGGVLILNWPTRRFLPGAASRMMIYATLTGLSAQLVLFTKAPVWVLLVMLPAFFAGWVFDRKLSTSDRINPAVFRTLFVGAVAAILAVIAVGLTIAILPEPDPYSS